MVPQVPDAGTGGCGGPSSLPARPPRRSPGELAHRVSAAAAPGRPIWAACAALLLLLSAPAAATVGASPDPAPYWFQSGSFPGDSFSHGGPGADAESRNDDSYAGGMAYDAARNLLFLTGSTYGGYFDGDGADVEGAAESGGAGGGAGAGVHLGEAGCFLAVLGLPESAASASEGGTEEAAAPTSATPTGGGGGDGGVRLLRTALSVRPEHEAALPDPSTQPRLVHAARMGVVGRGQACSAVALAGLSGEGGDRGGSWIRLAVLGHTEEGGLLTGLREKGTEKAEVYGLALDVGVLVDGGGADDDGGSGSDGGGPDGGDPIPDDAPGGGGPADSANATADGGGIAGGGPPSNATAGGDIGGSGPPANATAGAKDGGGNAPPPVATNSTGIDTANSTVVGANGTGADADPFPNDVRGLASRQAQWAPHGDGDHQISHVLRGGRLFRDAKVQRPVAVAVPPAGSDFEGTYFVAVQSSDEDYDSRGWGAKGSDPMAVVRDGQRPRDGDYIAVHKVGYKTRQRINDESMQAELVGWEGYPYSETLYTLWGQEFEPSGEKFGLTRPGAMVAGLLYVHRPSSSLDKGGGGDFLVMAGTTAGHGSAFGSNAKSAGDLDGFVTKLRADTGKELNPEVADDNNQAKAGEQYSARISSQPGYDEVIHGACLDSGAVYVVGSTTGTVDPTLDPAPTAAAEVGGPHPFVVRLDLNTLEVDWARQLASVPHGSVPDGAEEPGGAHASGCVVTPDGGLYVVGTVRDGYALSYSGAATEPLGGDDAFATYLTSDAGSVRWVRQFGTGDDDYLASGGGGGAVAVDGAGNALLYGTTAGSWARWRGTTGVGTLGSGGPRDVFVVSVSPQGEVRSPLDGMVREGGGGDRDSAERGGGVTTPDPVENDTNVGAIGVRADGRTSALGISLITMLSLLIVLVGGAFVFKHHRRRREHDIIRATYAHDVTKYLEDFDEADVEVRGSATGGFHGVYSFEVCPPGFVPPGGLSRIGEGAEAEDGEDTDTNLTGHSWSSVAGGGADRSGSVSASVYRRSSSGASSSSSSSIVRESLFLEGEDDDGDECHEMDEFVIEDEDQIAGTYGTNALAEDGWGVGYTGLVESYDQTWMERSPHNI